MNLSDFCRRITGPDARLLPENHKLGARLICPEYSKSVQEVKTYPLLSQDRSFLLCWNFDSPGNLYATMMPSPENFCYHYSYSDGEYTQLHTHDYLELSYVVDGEFHQRRTLPDRQELPASGLSDGPVRSGSFSWNRQ